MELWNCRSEHTKNLALNMGLQQETSLEGGILCGAAKTLSELDRSCEVGANMKAKWRAMATPSEIWHEYARAPWGQCFWADAVEVGSGMAGSWNIMASGPKKLEKVLR